MKFAKAFDLLVGYAIISLTKEGRDKLQKQISTRKINGAIRSATHYECLRYILDCLF